jgi:hypothetical protein
MISFSNATYLHKRDIESLFAGLGSTNTCSVNLKREKAHPSIHQEAELPEGYTLIAWCYWCGYYYYLSIGEK